MIKSPFHVGHFLRMLLEEHGIAQTQLAKHLGVHVGVINQICNEKRSISPELAVRLSRALRTSPEFWLNLQRAYELARQAPRQRIKPLVRIA